MIIRPYNPDRETSVSKQGLTDEQKTAVKDKIKALVKDRAYTYQEVREYLKTQNDLPNLTGYAANGLIREVDETWRDEEYAVNNPEKEPEKDPIEEPVG